MTQADRPLFVSAHAALLFAYTFSDNQYGIAAAAERSIESFGRKRYPDPPAPAPRGLGGLDGAAQAGMIKRQVAQLAPSMRQMIAAKFALLASDERRLAMAGLALRFRHGMRPEEEPLAFEFVRRHFGAGRALWQICEDRGIRDLVPERRVRRLWLDTRHRLQELERQSMTAVEIRLENAGIIAPVER